MVDSVTDGQYRNAAQTLNPVKDNATAIIMKELDLLVHRLHALEDAVANHAEALLGSSPPSDSVGVGTGASHGGLMGDIQNMVGSAHTVMTRVEVTVQRFLHIA